MPRFKRSLKILLLGVFGLAVIIGGYFVFRYPSIVPPLHHQKQTDPIKTVASNLPSETAQPLAMQPTQNDTSASGGQSPANPSSQATVPQPGKNRGAFHLATPNSPSAQPQDNPSLTDELDYVTGRTKNVVKNLLNSTVDFSY